MLGPGEFIYGFRDNRSLPARDRELLRELAAAFESRRWGVNTLRALLAHDDARVRTLALVALYDREDPRLLPDIFRLVGDEAPTFPALLPDSRAWLTDPPLGPERLREQTVGGLANAMLRPHLESAGYSGDALGRDGQDGFANYWKTRAGRSSSAGWWSVRLARAGHATSPTPQERYRAIRSLRAEIDELPEPDHTHVLLWLHGDAGSDVLVSEGELVGLTQRLGPDNLIDILRRRIRSDDPDLQARESRWPHDRMRLFVMQHATALLRPGDAQVLLDQEAAELALPGFAGPLHTPWWAIASADLRPADAVGILTRARDRFMGQYDLPKRLELTEALWRLGGDSQAQAVVDWYYRELTRPQLNNGGVARTMDFLLRTAGRDNRLLARTFIEDSRFDTLNWKSLEVLVKAMNDWSGTAIVSADDMARVYSPIGTDFFDVDRIKALEQYPNEVGALVQSMARWRRALRDNIGIVQQPSTPLFTFHSNPWLNLHHFLRAAARGAPVTADLSDDERAIWNAGIEFYKPYGARNVFDDEMVSIKWALHAAETQTTLDGIAIDSSLRAALERVAPIYLKHWWPAHDRANRAWIAGAQPLLDRHGAALAKAVTAVYGASWTTEPMPVDLSWVGGPSGAYSTGSPRHITMPSSDSTFGGNAALEMLFHEASHHWGQILGTTIFGATKNLGVSVSPQLWHSVLFYTAGELTTRELRAKGVTDYVEYSTRANLYTPMCGAGCREKIVEHWTPRLDGKRSIDEALTALVASFK